MQSRTHVRTFFFALSIALVWPACHAQQPEKLTLQRVIAIALGQNPDEDIARSTVASADLQRKLARTALLPNLQFGESVTLGDDPVYVFGSKLRQHVFAQSDFNLNRLNRPLPLNNFTTRVSGGWLAFDSWHTQSEIRRADLLAKSADYSSTRSSQEIILRTVRAYESLVLATKLVDTSQQEVATAQALLDSSLIRVEAGLTVEADLLSARVYLAERQQEMIAARGQVAIGWAELEAATGKPIPAAQRSLAPLGSDTFAIGTVEFETALALKSRPDRASLSLQGDAERVGVRSAEASFGPQVKTFGDWEADRSSIAGSGGDNWTAGVEIRIDLLPIAKRQGVIAAKIAVNRANAMQAAADREITLEVIRALYEHQAAMEMLAVARASVSEAAESLRTLQDRYTAGLATMTDLMRAQDAERRSRTSYEQAVSRGATTFAVLKFADGTLNPDIAGDLQ